MEKTWIDQLLGAAPYIGTAVAGCTLQAIKTNWRGWRNYIVSSCSAGFGAWLVFQLVPDTISQNLGMFAAGMVGYSGGSLVDVAYGAFVKHIEEFSGKASDIDRFTHEGK